MLTNSWNRRTEVLTAIEPQLHNVEMEVLDSTPYCYNNCE